MLPAISALIQATPTVPFPDATSVTELRFTTFFSGPSKHFSETLIDRVLRVFTTIIFSMIKFGFFVINPNLFALGFIGGVAGDQTSVALNRIKFVWYKQSYWVRAGLLAPLSLTLPTVASITSFLWASEIGNYLYHTAAGEEANAEVKKASKVETKARKL